MEEDTAQKILMAAESENTKIAGISKDISYIQRDIQEIKIALRDVYATKDALVQIAKETEARLTRLENSSNMWRWLSPTLAAILGSTLTFLLQSYLINLR